MKTNTLNHGGHRVNAGRKKIEGRVKATFELPQELNNLLLCKSKEIGLSKNKLLEKILNNYLFDCKIDFVETKKGYIFVVRNPCTAAR